MTEQLAPPSTISRILEEDHRVIDEHFARFAASLETGSPDVVALHEGTRALKHHIWVEEELHFPPLRDGDLIFQLVLLYREHGEIWLLLDTLADEVATGRDPSHTFQTLLSMLECHNPKEEQLIYPAGDDLLDADTSAHVRQAMGSRDIPDGWLPQLPVE